jgi:hypothetical protein
MSSAPNPGVTSMTMAMLLSFSSVAATQDWGRILEDKARQRASRYAEESIDKGLDAAEDAVRCVVTDQACIDSARQSGNGVVLTNEQDKALPPPQQLPADQATHPGPADTAPVKRGTDAGSDRFKSIIERAPESTVRNGFVINNRRVAVQKELSARPPTRDELGVEIPKGARLELERTARQIAQHHPYWRIYEYAVEMPQADLLRFFTEQGLTFDRSRHELRFSKPAGNGKDFIDNLQGDPVRGFRIWRVPRGASLVRRDYINETLTVANASR